MKIGFFDSGVGGLTVLQQALTRLANCSFVYVADSAYAPYGRREPKVVRARCQSICDFLIEQGCEAIVVACNTATALAVDQLREQYQLPIIAMEPALKPAAGKTHTGHIAVLATAGTFGSDRYAQLKDRHGQSIVLHERICHHWVEAVEQKDLQSSWVLDLVNDEVAPLLEQGVDVLVLGCTHFPFLIPAIRKVAGEEITLIDPAPAVIDQLCRSLSLAVEGTLVTPDLQLFTSGETSQVSSQVKALSGIDVAAQSLRI